MTEGTDSSISTSAWRDAVLSILKGTTGELKLKKLRKQTLISLQLDDSDKAAKKTFKRTAQGLEESGELSIDAEGLVSLTASPKAKKKKRKLKKEEKKSKKKRKKHDNAKQETTTQNDDNDDNDDNPQAEEEDDDKQRPSSAIPDDDDTDNAEPGAKNKPCKGNPQGYTRLFLGNLPFAVDEASIGTFLKKVTHIKWITDKETGRFYGSAFVEMKDSMAAAEAVNKLAGQSLMGRPIKINYAPARPGEVWPPEKRVITGGATSSSSSTTGGQAGGSGVKAMSAKPDNCVKLFIGNLSYDIDDDSIAKFFDTVGAEIKAVRWLHHKDSGDFKGCGFVEFWKSEDCDKGATLNGKNLLGRPIRIDWTD